MYNIKLDQFEGPLDLLLNLIEEQKLDVTQVSLAKVAGQYLEYLKKKDNITLENLADFLSVAAKLILIKSKALLPLLEFSDEEEQEVKDLEQKILEYKKFKDAAKKLKNISERGKTCFSRDSFLEITPIFYPPENVNGHDLKKTFSFILNQIPLIEKLEQEMIREVITLEEKINHLRGVIKEKMEASFSEIASSAKDKIDVIISFLAMLELVKQRIIEVEQSGLFHDIKIKNLRDKI
ncbi:MAG: hypothetical protein A3J63_04915 [Candidatus Moranbacteria bacterium RIFCSPHIGHO2_02_FULL_40_12b]|nr:MAG: hypothetical protein A3J63_04915 [Candidatus Moranbacteria bacterium RIFCSPHIGHO2_02_FULL_40_12b]